MFRILLPVLLAALQATSFAQSFQAENGAFVWKNGDEFVRFDNGRWTAGIEGLRSVSWHAFYWHDDWKYETLHGGTAQAGPTLNDDGTITMSGLFSAREGTNPLKYTCTVTPEADAVQVRCELEKTGELELRNQSAWLHIFAEKKDFADGQRLWAKPAWHGSLGSSGEGDTNALMIELADCRSLQFALPKFHPINTEGNPNSYITRLGIAPVDFPVGTKVAAEYTISFAQMPERFPGEVQPMKEELAIRGVTADAESVGLYDRLELTVDLGATYDNPYDPDDVALDAVLTSPSGRVIELPGFFMVAYDRTVQDNAEVMEPIGNGAWKVRFAPQELGTYTWALRLRDRTGEVRGGEGSFEVTEDGSKGFVRVSKADPHYMAFDNGEGYFAIGHNLPIYHTSGQPADEAMRRFAAAKENFNRWWMCSYGFGIEWENKLGWYRQRSAAQIDYSLDWAKELGLYYMMCMDTHQDFREGGWQKNPFNKANGGPCETAGEWFTNDDAKELYRKRLRYTVARWGYSPNVLCWEFGNEMEGWADSPDEIKLPWHREMSDYLASIDPFDHLITTSFWSHTGPEAFWRLPSIDIVQTHCYTNNDENVGPQIRSFSLHQWNNYEKPHIFGEFGIRSHSTTADKDPEGWGIHNALWSGLTNMCAGPPMPWWHENYIDKLDLYFHFTALANFVEGLPLGSAKWEPVTVSEPEYQDPNREPDTGNVTVMPRARWGKPEDNEFVILPDGTVADERIPQELLQGLGHQDIKNPPTFIVDYPADGQFVMQVRTVSNSGLVRIWLDGEQVAEVDLPCGEGLGKESVWREQWSLWETTYDRELSIDVPAGKHSIRVENFGKDWVRVGSYVFTGCKVIDKPNMLACGMKTDGLAILWLQNLGSSWFAHAGNTEVGKVDAFRVAITGLADGEYEMEWWETWKGSLERTETVTVRDGQFTLALPELVTDVAIKLRAR